jgi:hypothetical protein
MDLSANHYNKAKLILEFITDNPECNVHQIADHVSMLKGVAQIVVAKMVDAGCLTFSTGKIRGGRRYFYKTTGAPLLPRTPRVKKGPLELTGPALDPISPEEYRRLPSFLRALTPVVIPEARLSIVINGHTPEQHKLQSAVMRKDRSKALQGVKYSGNSRYE